MAGIFRLREHVAAGNGPMDVKAQTSSEIKNIAVAAKLEPHFLGALHVSVHGEYRAPDPLSMSTGTVQL